MADGTDAEEEEETKVYEIVANENNYVADRVEGDGIVFYLEVLTSERSPYKYKHVRYIRTLSVTDEATGVTSTKKIEFGSAFGFTAVHGTKYSDLSPSGHYALTTNVPEAIRALIPDSNLIDELAYDANGNVDTRNSDYGYYIGLPTSIVVTSGTVYDSTTPYYTNGDGEKLWPVGTEYGVVKEVEGDDEEEEEEEEGGDEEEEEEEEESYTPYLVDGGVVTGGSASESGNNEYRTFYANPSSGYKFTNWSTGSTANPLTIAVSDIPANGIYPVYQCVRHTYTCSTSGQGATITAKVDSATVASSASFDADDESTVEISATPTNDGDEISYWLVGGVRYDSQTLKFDMSSSIARNVAVVCYCVTPRRFRLTISKTNGDCGTVAASGNGNDYVEVGGTLDATLECDTNYTLTATRNDTSLHRFLGWYDGDTLLSTSQTYIINRSTLTDYAITAKFEEIPYYKCEVENATEDTVQYDGYVGCGTTLTPTKDITIDGVDKWLSTQMSIQATGGSGYGIVKWEVTDLDGGNNGFTNPATGSLTGVSNPLVFTLNFNAKVKAYFSRNVFHARAHVMPSSQGGGSVAVVSGTAGHTCENLVANDVATFTATPATGFAFDGWKNEDGSAYSSNNSLQVTISDDDVDLYAAFRDTELGTSVIQKWQGLDTSRMMTWRSKVYEFTQPTSPVTLRVDAKEYPVIVKVGTFSSPDAATQDDGESRYVELTITDQNARKIPTLRPERFLVVQVKSRGEVDAVIVGTSMMGMTK